MDHPHGMSATMFTELFTDPVDVVFAFHGYPGAIHQLVHGRPDADRFRVRGFIEEGTTTTPFDMTVRNRASRYHLVMDAINNAKRLPRGRHRAEGVVRAAARQARGVRRRSTWRTCPRCATGPSVTGPRRADALSGRGRRPGGKAAVPCPGNAGSWVDRVAPPGFHGGSSRTAAMPSDPGQSAGCRGDPRHWSPRRPATRRIR